MLFVHKCMLLWLDANKNKADWTQEEVKPNPVFAAFFIDLFVKVQKATQFCFLRILFELPMLFARHMVMIANGAGILPRLLRALFYCSRHLPSIW
jgi:hypothetical protein